MSPFKVGCFIGGMLLAGVAMAQQYNVDFQAGGGLETVTGSIILAPGTTGNVTANEVAGWSLQGSGFAPFSYEGFAANCGGGDCGLTVSGTDLLFTPAQFPLESGASFGQDLGFGSAGGRDPGPVFAMTTDTSDYRLLLPSGTVIGKDPPTLAAPEIGPGAASAITLLIALILMVTDKRRID